MTDEFEEKRPFSYMNIKALMMLSAAAGAIMVSEAECMNLATKEEIEAYPTKRRKELEDKLSKILDGDWDKKEPPK